MHPEIRAPLEIDGSDSKRGFRNFGRKGKWLGPQKLKFAKHRLALCSAMGGREKSEKLHDYVPNPSLDRLRPLIIILFNYF